jgi:hypothetical protein
MEKKHRKNYWPCLERLGTDNVVDRNHEKGLDDYAISI